jgi:hypothetical protein
VTGAKEVGTFVVAVVGFAVEGLALGITIAAGVGGNEGRIDDIVIGALELALVGNAEITRKSVGFCVGIVVGIIGIH